MLVAAELMILDLAVLAAPAFIALVLAAYLCSPLHRRPGPSHWEAQRRHVRDERPVVYWRPGSIRTMRLRLALRRAGIPSSALTWVDIWHDSEGAAYARDLNDGAEKVPTIILPDGSAVTRPDPKVVVESLEAARAGEEPSRDATGGGSRGGTAADQAHTVGAERAKRPGRHRVGRVGRR